MVDIIISFLIGLAIGGTGGSLAGVWIAYNLQPRQEIQYITQNTTQETTQKTDVFQGQITIVVSGNREYTNINVNISGLTNFHINSNTTTNYTLTNKQK